MPTVTTLSALQTLPWPKVGLSAALLYAALLGGGGREHATTPTVPTPSVPSTPPPFCHHNFLLGAPEAAHLRYMGTEYFLLSGAPHPPMISPPPAQKPLSAGELHNLNRHMRNRLPRYRPLFTKIAKEHQIDWHLIAAISYQESHWHPKARSPTGVRGLMMLTLPTAKELGIRNRLDAEQSVKGGVLYLEKLKKRLPKSIEEPDRTWSALVAYNIGIGHLYDARILAQKHGSNPDLWADLRVFLNLLEKPEWHTQTRHGYARGGESVRYVENIQRYHRHITDKLTKNPPAETVIVQNKSQNTKG